MLQLNVFISVQHHIKLRFLSVTRHPQEEQEVSCRKESIINMFPYARYYHIHAVLVLVSKTVYLFRCTVQTEWFIKTSQIQSVPPPNTDGMWLLSQSWSREAFLIITSFFTGRLCHALKLCLSTLEENAKSNRFDHTIPQRITSATLPRAGRAGGPGRWHWSYAASGCKL